MVIRIFNNIEEFELWRMNNVGCVGSKGQLHFSPQLRDKIWAEAWGRG